MNKDFFGRPILDEWSWWEGEERQPFMGRHRKFGPSVAPSLDQRKGYTDYKRDGVRLMDELKTTPLAFLEEVMEGKRMPSLNAMEAAKAILPYRHRKMPVAVEQSGPNGAAIPQNLTIRFVKPDASGQS